VDPANGGLLWKSDWPGRTAVIPTPIADDNKIFIASGYGVGCKLVEINRDQSIRDVWMNTNMKNHHGGVILLDGHLYGFSDGFGWVCMRLDNGELVWREKDKLGKGAISYADGKFYLLEEGSGEVVLIDATTKGWSEKGRFKLDPQTENRSPKGKIWVHPVIVNGRMYLRDQELFFSYDVSHRR
jgi:outer membrane protein assembly factor BamB